jgi:hypothetical protein
MKDASFKVYRGSNQSILANVFTSEAAVTRLNVSGKPVRAFVKRSEDGPIILSKLCRTINAATGEIALDLTPAESRLVPEGRKVLVEFKVFDGTEQYIVGRGILTGLFGISLDTNT